MKKMKLLLSVMCVAIMVFGIITSASATYYILESDIGDTDSYKWQLDENCWFASSPSVLKLNEVELLVEYPTDKPDLVELYKMDSYPNNPDVIPEKYETGSYASPYSTEFLFNFKGEALYANISYDGPSDGSSAITSDPIYLLVKDGNQGQYFFDVSNWDGMEDIFIDQLWSPKRSISHVALYAPVPVPAALWLLGSGLLGLVAFGRRFKK